jgi:phage terminase large subunit-like protein
VPHWTTACPDWRSRIVEKQPLIPFDPLFPDEARDALAVFDSLRMVDAIGSPTMGEVSRPWVRQFVAAIFGAYDPDTGRRIIQEFFLLISKKNGKSTDAAAIMLTALIRNWRNSGEFLILAPTIEIANNSFFPARDMVRADEELSDLMHVQDHYRTITHRQTGATLKVVAADNDSVGGKKGIGIFVDELWLFGKQPNAENMLREATGGLASRPEGFVIYSSTQSDAAPAGVFRQKLQYARGVRDGRIDDKKFLPVIYEYPEEMKEAKAYRDKSTWYITNPNLGASVDAEFLEREFAKADEAGEVSLVGFLSKHLNVEIGLALNSDRWAGADYWEQQGTKGLSLGDLIKRCEVICAGIDGGGLDDLFGLALLGREKITGNWLLWSHAWVHPIALNRRKSEAARFRDFQKAGELTIVDKIGQDLEEVVDIVEKVDKAGLLERIGVDQAGIGALIDALTARGITADRIIGIPQGWKLNGAIKTCERKLAEGALFHGDSALMAWSVGNAKVEPKGNAVTITKQASGFAKIDPLMALFDAVSLLALNPEPRFKEPSIRWL